MERLMTPPPPRLSHTARALGAVLGLVQLAALMGCGSPTVSATPGDVVVGEDAADLDVTVADSDAGTDATVAPDAPADAGTAGADVPDVAAPTIPLEDLPRLAAVMFCKADASLPTPTFALDSCMAQANNYASKPLRDRIALVQLGRVTYDGVAAAACLAAADNMTALRIFFSLGTYLTPRAGAPAVLPICAKVFTGDNALGDACDDDAECATGRCWGCPTGICRAPVALGQPCGADAPCAQGLCFLGLCQPDVDLPVGATCVDIVDTLDITPSNDVWFSQIHCQNPAICQASTPGLGACVVGQPVGAACGADKPCEQGATCYGDGLCHANVSKGKKCGTTTCTLSQACVDANKTCVPWAVVGESCAQGEVCAQSTCDPQSKKCSAPNPCGPSCQQDACGADGKCKLNRLGDGCTDKCVNDGMFPTELVCIDGACRRKHGPACTFPVAGP